MDSIINSKDRITVLLRNGSKTFQELLDSMLGMYPMDLINELEILISEGVVIKQAGRFCLSESISLPTNNIEIAKTKLENIISVLHNPHSLDYEWWFTVDTAENIFLGIKNFVVESAKICFLGAPLIGAFCRYAGIVNEICIIDKSAPTLATIHATTKPTPGLTLINHDLQYPLPEEILGKFDLVFLDPPWYVDYYKLFLSRAIEVLGRGHICVAMFPLLTRPNAIEERHEIFEAISNMGLVPIRLEEQILTYQTPLFEKISLSYHGITVAENWRKGDLLSLVSSARTEPLITGAYKIEVDNWQEVVIGKSKIKIRLAKNQEYETPLIKPLYKESPILKSVSRRDPKRKEIDLWTSKHQVFKLDGNNVVFLVLKGISEGLEINEIVSNISEAFKIIPETIQEEALQCYAKLKEVIDYEIA